MFISQFFLETRDFNPERKKHYKRNIITIYHRTLAPYYDKQAAHPDNAHETPSPYRL